MLQQYDMGKDGASIVVGDTDTALVVSAAESKPNRSRQSCALSGGVDEDCSCGGMIIQGFIGSMNSIQFYTFI